MQNRPQALLFLILALAASSARGGDATELRPALERACAAPKPWTLSPGSDCSRIAARAAGQTWDLRPHSTLALSAIRTDRSLGGLRLRWIVHSRTGGIYQAAHAAAVSNAAPSDVRVSLLPERAGLVPLGHQRPWDDLAAAEVTAIELRAECAFTAGAEALTVKILRLQLEPRETAGDKPEVVGLRVLPPPASSRGAAQLLFRLSPMPVDPFAADGEGDVRVDCPDSSFALAYVDQDYVPREDGSHATALPAGAPYFRAVLPALPARGTFTIRSGEHAWAFDAALLNALREQTPAAHRAMPAGRWTPSLTATIAAQTPHGLPRVSSVLKRRKFEPVSHTAPSGACWRPVPFWTAEWGGFSNALQPNLELAARLDGALHAAAQAGEIRPMLLFDGATLGRDGPFNWLSHPAREQLSGPGELYRSPEGEQFLRRWMRYALARWGHSKAVNELWIALEALAPGDAAFFARLAPSLALWTASNQPPIYTLHPFAAESGTPQTLATFNGNDPVNWFADARQGQSYGGRNGSGSDGQHAFELRARTASEQTIGMTADYTRVQVQWNQPAPDNFSGGDTLLFDLQLPPGSPADLRVGVHLRDRDGLWFQALLPNMPHPGDWTTLALDLSGRNVHGLMPVGHAKPWTPYSRQRLVELGLHLYSTHTNWTPQKGAPPQPLRATVDHLRLVQRPAEPASPAAITVMKQRVVRGGTEVLDLREAAVGDLYECDVAINRVFENPFDPVQCDFSATLALPSGKAVRVPLFFNQPCARREETPGGDELVEPQGAEHFTLRYRILEAGAHRVTYELRTGGRYDVQRDWAPDSRFTPDGRGQAAAGRARWGGTQYPEQSEKGRRPVETVRFVPGPVSVKLEPAEPAFSAQKAARPFKGFIRAAADRRHFEFDDGSFYYALGPCVRSPSDRRIAYVSDKWSPDEIERLGRRGTYQYDDYFAAYEKAGINWARVWMCPWWGALEWRRDWPGYQGVGRYNQLNAWRVDHLLAEAERRGIYISLCLTNHGQYSLHVDSEWQNNPYSARLGGPLIAASEFFSRGDAKILHQNKLRYIVARYGHSPAIASWALFSELEWTEEYEPYMRHGEDGPPATVIDRWHTEMATFLREQDPNDHLTLTHFSHPTTGNSTLALEAVDIAASNAYSAFQEFGPGRMDAAFALSSYWSGYPDGNLRGMNRFNKPVIVEEQGRHWMGGKNNTEHELRADLHTQLWGGVVQPIAGATGYWWWVQLHIDNRYDEYAALARFLKGEDFRPMKGETPLEPAFRGIPAQGGELHGRALKSNRRLYAWVYHPNTPYGRETPERANGEVRVGGLQAGAYTLEFWDTAKGEMIEERDVNIGVENGKPQSITFKIPPVQRDMALKLKPKK